jgi:hypothetical protein
LKVAKTFVYNEKQSMESNIRRLEQDTSQLFEAFKGRVRFGTGTNGDRGENIQGHFQVVTTAGADTEFAIAHGTGAVPIGYIVLKQDKAGSFYESGTTWTDTNIYLKCSTATVTATLFVIK